MTPRRLFAVLIAASALAAACGSDAPPASTPPQTAPAPPPQVTIPAPPDVAGPPATAKKSPSGLAWIVLKPGTGTIHPTATSEVTVNYTGWKTNGEMFDSSVLHGGPATMALNGVIKGWTEGVQLMVLGEKRRFWVPGPLGYDDVPGEGNPKGTLVFDIELLDIK